MREHTCELCGKRKSYRAGLNSDNDYTVVKLLAHRMSSADPKTPGTLHATLAETHIEVCNTCLNKLGNEINGGNAMRHLYKELAHVIGNAPREAEAKKVTALDVYKCIVDHAVIKRMTRTNRIDLLQSVMAMIEDREKA